MKVKEKKVVTLKLSEDEFASLKRLIWQAHDNQGRLDLGEETQGFLEDIYTHLDKPF